MLDKYHYFSGRIKETAGGNILYHLCRMTYMKTVLGFGAEDYFIYQLYRKTPAERKQIMTGKQARTFEHEMNDEQESMALGDKRTFNNRFCAFTRRDFLYLYRATPEEFSSFCRKHPDFMLKKNWLCEGQGVRRCHLSGEQEIDAFFQENKGDALVEELIVQHPEMNALHPQSVNTVRVSTLFAHGKAHIIAAALRVGTGENCTDNLHNAGIACPVNLSDGSVNGCGYDKAAHEYENHPDTGISLQGFRIPNWKSVTETVVSAAEEIPTVRWIGWDVAITEDGCLIVEGNTNQAVDLIQMGQEGIWPKIKRVCEV